MAAVPNSHAVEDLLSEDYSFWNSNWKNRLRDQQFLHQQFLVTTSYHRNKSVTLLQKLLKPPNRMPRRGSKTW